MSCWIFLIFLIPVFFGTILADCGNVSQNRDVQEGDTVNIKFLPKPGRTADIWYFSFNGIEPNLDICWNSNSSCTSQKYHLNRDTLTVNNFTRRDAGHYTVKCYRGNWSRSAVLSIKLADKSASNKQQDTSKERANEYSSTTLETSTEEKKTEKTEIIDTATDYKVSSTLEDRSQVTTIVVAGVVAVGLLLTVIAVAVICKKYKKNSSHQASQKSGQKQIFEGADGQDNSLPNDSGRSHSRQSSERETSALQYEAEHNPGALYDQQASGSVAEQINSEYATVVPTQDRISGTQQRDINKVVVKEEEGSPEYATVVKSREPVCRVEQSVQGDKDKNEHGLVYADLDLVSRPRREAASKEHEATEYVSIDFQKTATLKSQQKK